MRCASFYKDASQYYATTPPCKGEARLHFEAESVSSCKRISQVYNLPQHTLRFLIDVPVRRLRLRLLLHAALCLSLLSAPPDAGALPNLRRLLRSDSTATQRKRLHVNDLIAEPGTVEIDWGNLYSYTSGTFTMRSALKYTPGGTSVLWGRTEYSISFDSISSAVDTGTRKTQFSDHVSLTATAVVLDTAHFDIAVAPQTTFLVRDASGTRLGATVIARADLGLSSLGATIGWSGATTSSISNPAGSWDVGVGLGRHLAEKGVLQQITPHMNAIWERSTGVERTLSAFAGVEYQITPRVAFDVTGQRIGLPAASDRQILAGMTINLGKLTAGR